LTQVYKQTGKLPKQLAEAPPFPEGLSYVWDWYMELATTEPLPYAEIKAWAEIMDIDVLPWEAKLVKSLDRIFWRVHYD